MANCFALAVGLSVAVQSSGASVSGRQAETKRRARGPSEFLSRPRRERGSSVPDSSDRCAGPDIERPLTDGEEPRPTSGLSAAAHVASRARQLDVWFWNRGRKRFRLRRPARIAAGFPRVSAIRGGSSGRAQPEPGHWLSWRLPPGDAVKVTANLVAPNATGRMQLAVELVQFDFAPFSRLGSSPIVAEVDVIPGPGYDDFRRACEWRAIDGAQVLASGVTADTDQVRNYRGCPGQSTVRMSYWWRRLDALAPSRRLRTICRRDRELTGALVNTRTGDVPGEYLRPFRSRR